MSADDLAWLTPGVSVHQAARRLLDDGPAVVLATDGAECVIVLGRSFGLEVDIPRVEVVDTVGAGDAFGGAFLAWWTEQGLTRSALTDRDAVADGVTQRRRGGRPDMPARGCRTSDPCRGRLVKRVARPALVVVAATFLFLAMAPTTAAFTTRYPTQSPGNRGSDVRAARDSARPRLFDPFRRHLRDRDAQRRHRLPDGVRPTAERDRRRRDVGEARHDRPASGLGPAVRILQTELTRSVGRASPFDGIYTTATQNAGARLPAPHVDPRQRRRWRPDLARTAVALQTPIVQCLEPVRLQRGNGPRTGRPASVGQLERRRVVFAATWPWPRLVGDAGFEHGGTSRSTKHAPGRLNIHIRPIRKVGEP